MDLPSRLDLYSIGRNYLLSRATKIDPAQVDVQGTDSNLFVGSQSEVAYACILQLAFGLSTKLLDNATGDDLDRYAWDRYQLSRKGASAALGAVTFSRVNFTGGPGTIATGTLLATSAGAAYITTQPATFGASDTSASAAVRAVQAGKLQQAGANSIVLIKQQSALFDQTITVNNPLPTAGGEDVEDDDTFRNRVRQFWTTARRGILAAISFGALQVPGVVSAQAIEVINGLGQPARLVNLFISDSSGVASAQLAQQVVTALADFRAAGIQVIVSTSIPQIQNVVLHLTFASGVDTVSLGVQVQAAIVNFINSLPVNGTLFLAQLQSVLQRFVSQGLIVGQGTIVSPIGDVVPAIGLTLRTTTANVVLQ